MIFIKDVISAAWAWISIWSNDDLECIERRIRFINDLIDEPRKHQLPYKLIMKAYRKRVKQLKNKA